MRPTLALALGAAALLAGCTVDTEGAQCRSDANCPSGQACEYAGKCSKAAAGCAAPICHQDACTDALTPKVCNPDGNRVCATWDTSVATCSNPDTCGIVAGRAECFHATITAPISGAEIPIDGLTARVTLTFAAQVFAFPPSVELRSGATRVATLGLQGLPQDKVVTYVGSFVPAQGLETSAYPLRAVAGAPIPVESTPVTVDVDTLAPRITSQAATCPLAPCLRDDVVTLAAQVDDANLRKVEVTLDLDAFARPTAMVLTPGTPPTSTAQGALSLKDWAFPAAARAVVVHFVATDLRGNVSAPQSTTLAGVTRVRQAFDTGLGNGVAVTSPAIGTASESVVAAGTAIFGTATTTGQLRAILPDGTPAWSGPTTLEVSSPNGRPLLTAPSIGIVNIFAGSEDGRIYRVLPSGALPTGTTRSPASTSFVTVPAESLYTPAIASPAGVDHVYSAGGWGTLWQFLSDETTGGLLLQAVAPPPVTSVVRSAGVFIGTMPYFAVSNAGTTSVRRFVDTPLTPTAAGSIDLTDAGTPPVPCDQVAVPLAVDGAASTTGNVIAACANGQIHRVSTGATMAYELIFTLPAAPTGSPVVLQDGGILLPSADGKVRKLVPGTGVAWTANAGGPTEKITGLVAVKQPVVDGTLCLATTDAGRLVAIDVVGNVAWSADLGAGALSFPTVAPARSGVTGALPTLLVGSANGKLLRVVVDTGLDDTAPWPKAHHDLRNTGNRSASLP